MKKLLTNLFLITLFNCLSSATPCTSTEAIKLPGIAEMNITETLTSAEETEDADIHPLNILNLRF